ncbi:MAG TPA: HEAT repeat domain-containing protein [Verrucomicrobiae bacterium]|nr:HEAT repeat domain-containing protein [Verrucomicrobiae bacterium]
MALFVALAVGMGVVVLLLLQPSSVREPVYRGKPLGEWLDAPAVTGELFPSEIGTNAIPWLLHEASAHEIGLVSIAKEWLRQRFQLKLVTASQHQARAKRGFSGLGAAGGVAVAQGLTNSDKWIRFGCVGQWEVGKHYPDLYIPNLIDRLKDPNADVRARAANALGLMDHQQNEKIIPALIKALDDPNDNVRCMAAVGLGCIGKDANSAVPVLLKHLSNASPSFQYWITNSLKSLGPPPVGRSTTANAAKL